jgi:superfamily II DNA or RNA helicase
MKYPDIKDNNFYKKINNIFEEYKIPSKKRTFEEICFPKEYKLQMPQQFVSHFINPKTPYKSGLIIHNIGSGKTCTAVRVGEEWKYYKKIIVLTPASLKGNFRNELRSLCAQNSYLTPTERKKLSELHPTSPEYKEIIEKSDERIDKYYDILSYHKFTELAQNNKINLKNSVLIIDEIQNMVSEGGTFYEVLLEQINKAPKDLRIILLSATPMFDRPSEIALTYNLLRPDKPMPISNEFNKLFINIKKGKNENYKLEMKNHELFKKYLKGYISYFRGAPSYVFPTMKLKFVKCEMSDFQYNAYKKVLRSNEQQIGRISKKTVEALAVGDLPNNFFIGTRVISNIAFPNNKINEEGFESLKGVAVTRDLWKYSCKFDLIIKKIMKNSGKMFVYSGFKEYGGIKSFVKVLEIFGFKNYMEQGEGKKRFAIFSGDENIKKKEEIKSVFNNKNNLDGSKLKLLILSPAAKEGLSLFGIKQAHILEPYWNWSRMLQIIGRGSRYCSHKDLDKENRKIKVYIYHAVHPDEKETVDEHISYLAKQKHKLISQFEKSIKEAAIDCHLNINANQEEGEKIICDK